MQTALLRTKFVNVLLLVVVTALGMSARCTHLDEKNQPVEEPILLAPEKSSDDASEKLSEFPEDLDNSTADRTYDDGELPLQQGADKKM